MYCTNCGTQLADTAKFCSNCGKPTDGIEHDTRPNSRVQDTRKSEAKGTHEKWTKLEIGLAVLGVLLALITVASIFNTVSFAYYYCSPDLEIIYRLSCAETVRELTPEYVTASFVLFVITGGIIYQLISLRRKKNNNQ